MATRKQLSHNGYKEQDPGTGAGDGAGDGAGPATPSRPRSKTVGASASANVPPYEPTREAEAQQKARLFLQDFAEVTHAPQGPRPDTASQVVPNLAHI